MLEIASTDTKCWYWWLLLPQFKSDNISLRSVWFLFQCKVVSVLSHKFEWKCFFFFFFPPNKSIIHILEGIQGFKDLPIFKASSFCNITSYTSQWGSFKALMLYLGTVFPVKQSFSSSSCRALPPLSPYFFAVCELHNIAKMLLNSCTIYCLREGSSVCRKQ